MKYACISPSMKYVNSLTSSLVTFTLHITPYNVYKELNPIAMLDVPDELYETFLCL